ncbi:MAG: hypothetical protein IPQ05_25345 [Leptospiraceae bacterium]|nr:hypothetical protein [Leptospiraceae bacterium]
MAIMYHPDKFYNAKPEIYELMNKKFIEAKDAHEFFEKEKVSSLNKALRIRVGFLVA